MAEEIHVYFGTEKNSEEAERTLDFWGEEGVPWEVGHAGKQATCTLMDGVNLMADLHTCYIWGTKQGKHYEFVRKEKNLRTSCIVHSAASGSAQGFLLP